MANRPLVRRLLTSRILSAGWMILLLAPTSGLAQQATQIQTVVVTGVFEPVPLEEADRPVDVIDVRKLDLVSNSLVDFLRLDSSVDLQERGPNGTQADVSIRGA